MAMNRQILAAAAIAVFAAAGAAAANPLDDARAGLKAFDSGDNQTAIQLFTSAINSGRLMRSDEELAYVKLAEARIAVGQDKAALADAEHALDLQPDDTEAAAARDRAKALIGSPAIAEKPKEVAPGDGAGVAPSISEYRAAMAKYDDEKRADAAAYDRQLQAYDAEVARQKAARAAELEHWRDDAKACEQGDESRCGSPAGATKPATTELPAAAKPATAKPAPLLKKTVAKPVNKRETPLPPPTITVY